MNNNIMLMIIDIIKYLNSNLFISIPPFYFIEKGMNTTLLKFYTLSVKVSIIQHIQKVNNNFQKNNKFIIDFFYNL